MKNIFRVGLLLAAVCSASMAVQISFTGTVTSTSGSFTELIPNGSPVQALIELNTVSSDLDPDDPNHGLYNVTVGNFSVIAGGSNGTINTAVSSIFDVETFFSESVQSFSVFAAFGGGSLLAVFEGTPNQLGNFLNGDAFPTNVNWSALTSAYGSTTITGTANVSAAVEAPIAEGDQFVYSIDSVNAIPEPGTVFGVAAGGLVLWLKRRQSR